MQRAALVPGNIDLSSRPAIPNPAGGTSTVYSASFNIDGREVLLPLADEGRILTGAEAVDKYKRTGRHLGIFATPADANAYADQLHRDYAAGKYGGAMPQSLLTPSPTQDPTVPAQAATTPTTPAAPLPPIVAPPDQILRQLRQHFPELSYIDDAELVDSALHKFPDWRAGVPPDARQRLYSPQSMAPAATTVSPPAASHEPVSYEAPVSIPSDARIVPPLSWTAWSRQNLPAIGAGAGSFFGPWGAAAGGAGGALTQAAWNQWGGVDQDPYDVVANVVTEGLTSGLLQKGGEFLVGDPLRKFAGGWYGGAMSAEKVGAAAARARQAARSAASRYHLPISAPELAGVGSKSKALAIGRSGWSPFARAYSEQLQEETKKLAEDAIVTELQRLTTSLSSPTVPRMQVDAAAGGVVRRGLQLARRVSRTEEKRLYDVLDTLIPTPVTDPSGAFIGMAGGQQGEVSLIPLKEAAKRIRATIGAADPLARATGESSIYTLLDAVDAMDPAVNFGEAQVSRSVLLSIARNIKGLPDRWEAIGDELAGIVDTAMEKTAKAAGTDVYNAWRRANAFTRARHDLFDRSIVARLIDPALAPENIIGKLKPTQITDAANLLKAFTRYRTFATPAQQRLLNESMAVMQQGVLANLVEDPTKISRNLARAEPLLDALFGRITPRRPGGAIAPGRGSPNAQVVRQNLVELGAAIDSLSRVRGWSPWAIHHVFDMAVTLATGAVGAPWPVAVAAGGTSFAAAETVPLLMAKVLYNPTWTRLLLDGLKALPAIGPAARAVSGTPIATGLGGLTQRQLPASLILAFRGALSGTPEPMPSHQPSIPQPIPGPTPSRGPVATVPPSGTVPAQPTPPGPTPTTPTTPTSATPPAPTPTRTKPSASLFEGGRTRGAGGGSSYPWAHPAAALLADEPAGRYTLSDGTVWEKLKGGEIRQVYGVSVPK